MTSYKDWKKAHGGLSEADERFYAERESGYTGWLDQDGHRCTEANTPPELWQAMQNHDRNKKRG